MLTKVMIVKLIIAYSHSMGFDPNLALAIAQTESGMNPMAIGTSGERGVMQVLPQYSEYSATELAGPKGIYAGIKLLKSLQKSCGKLGSAYIVCYNTGITGAKRLVHPKQFIYYKKVMQAYNQIKNERKSLELVILNKTIAFESEMSYNYSYQIASN